VPDPFLGYYDPRQPEVRKRQAQLATEHGIEAFCYWHMWFGGGRMLIHDTVEDVLRTGVPEMSYCLAWANQTWTRTWARWGSRGGVLLEQTYPGLEDHRSHFEYLLRFFLDHRYMRVDGRPVFVIYRPFDIPDRHAFLKLWQNLARDAGLPGVFFVGTITSQSLRSRLPDFDGYTRNQPPEQLVRYGIGTLSRAARADVLPLLRCGRGLLAKPQVFSDTDILRYAPLRKFEDREFPQILTSWDDTPRQGRRGTVLTGRGSDLLHKNVAHAVQSLRSRPLDQRLLFLTSWNEWGEGNYLEPDTLRGVSSLETIRNVVVGRT
jgi:hypothetical protein